MTQPLLIAEFALLLILYIILILSCPLFSFGKWLGQKFGSYSRYLAVNLMMMGIVAILILFTFIIYKS